MALPAPHGTSESEGVVLVYAYTFVPGSPETWADRIAASKERLTPVGWEVAAQARRDTGTLGGSDLRLGSAMPGHDVVLIPFEWHLPGVCGALRGELHLRRLDGDTTQISLRASHPDGHDGQHTLAEYAAKQFVDRLPGALGPALPTGSAAPASILPNAGRASAAGPVPE